MTDDEATSGRRKLKDSTAKLDDQGRWVLVRVQGDLDVGLMRRLTDQLLALVAEHDVFNVLADLSDVEGTPPPSAIQRLPEYYVSRDVDTRMTIAIVLPERGDRLGLSRFFKLNAQRRSYKVNIFDSRQLAEAWLTSLQPASATRD